MTPSRALEHPEDVDAVLFDFSDVIGYLRMAVAGEPGDHPYVVELHPAASGAVARLRAAGVLAALVTNNDRGAFAALAPDLGLDELFDAVVFSSDVGAAKPDFRIFSYALRAVGVDAHRAAFLDDNGRNVDAAAAMGMQGVVVDRPAVVVEIVDQVLSARA